VALAMGECRVSERRACKLLEMDRSSYRYEPQPDRNGAVRQELIAPPGRSRGMGIVVWAYYSGGGDTG